MSCWIRPGPSSGRIMADKPEIGLRYCGGCNSRYDRVALVKRLESFFPEATFVSARKAKATPPWWWPADAAAAAPMCPVWPFQWDA